MKLRWKNYLSVILALGLLTGNYNISSAETILNESNDKWELSWSDEFDDNVLNKGNWTFEEGNWILDESGNKESQGWGNNEAQYYTKGENISFNDGKLIITAKKDTENKAQHDNCEYTSTRIVTRDKVTRKYGRIEASIKMPEGSGLWPAFWMMPNDDKYGAWAASGELDIMEARGRVPNEVNGTIHYGKKWPNNKYTEGKYTFPEGEDITSFHEYAIEWEPGEIRWYIDDKLYQVQNNWNSFGEDDDIKYSFPAPFDQEFYMILNLAVGGNYDGGILPDSDFKSAEMQVDYVRVYDLKDGYEYKTPQEPNTEKGELPQGSKEAIDGNYIYDTNYEKGFTNIIAGNEEFSNTWNLVALNEFGGKANVSIEDINNNKFAKIDISNIGTQTYSVQLIQYATLVKGRSYKLSYDAKSDSNREVSIKLSGGADRGWSTYSDVYADKLSSEVKHYEHTFTMGQESDIKARLEFNLGLSNKPVWIGNVKLEEYEGEINYDSPKKPLSDGNHIYNGTFDRGDITRTNYWNITGDASISVDENNRELYVKMVDGKNNLEDVILDQKGIMLTPEAKHTLKFKGKADNNKDIKVVIKDSNSVNALEETISLENKFKEYTLDFNYNNTEVDNEAKIEFLFGGDNIGVYLDDISLICDGLHEELGELEKVLIKNGDFSSNLDNWNAWNYIKNDDFINDVYIEDGQAVIPIQDLTINGLETWAYQFKQTDLSLRKDMEYKLSFDISSTIDRELEVVLQNSGYYRIFQDRIKTTPEVKRYEYVFKATGTELAELNFLLGKYGDYKAHNVKIDNISLNINKEGEVTPEEPNNPKPEEPKKHLIINGDFTSNLDGWNAWNYMTYDNYINDIRIENGKAIIPIQDLTSNGLENWSYQFRQTGLELVKDIEYKLTFDISSTIERELEVVVQNAGYYRIFEDKIKITPDTKKYEYVFTATGTETAELNFLLGKYGDYKVHEVSIDNVSLNINDNTEEPEQPTEPENPSNPGTEEPIEPENPSNPGTEEPTTPENPTNPTNPEPEEPVVSEDSTTQEEATSSQEENNNSLPQTGDESNFIFVGSSIILLSIGITLLRNRKL